jgi:hypothetical protein
VPGSSRAQSAGDPSCHHAATDAGSRYHLRSQPKPCSHDERETGTQVAAATGGTSPVKFLHPPSALVTSTALSLTRSGTGRTRGVVLASDPGIASSFVLPLRV